ncbi:amino acid ABC transporter substrate-binding protein [Rhizobium anhuiense]|uniref:Amino acid ABC transporter substrate-binding protein n=1 Tax=Rhizobium anhuiense TaxID=1184720 RepID=A0ABX4J3D1_9HYPH|nr:transporter substrate-binding domain-containing protein [Rhizobium anhuiense]PDS41213.1 amino acid ABC transporter substrate-binding protein [Rhizobium anhuiense]PDS49671.1 amino acid ABC transporter substrate-binding protein [Rhizobium anhuiense]PDS59989.1 amino acid ABC transporter substrate-binding protein [Rhizobium anhuiense]
MFNRRMYLRALPALALIGALASSTMAYAAEDGVWSAAQKAGTLRCGTAEAPPYIMKDPATGEYSGFFVDLCREFADVLKVKPEFVDTTWDNMVAGLQAKKWDLAMALTATPQRALSITFSKNVSATESTFVYNKANPKLSEPKGLADVDKAGVTIAVSSGTAQDKYLTSALKNATIMRLPGPDEIRLAMMSKRADVVFDTSAANDLFAAANADTTVILRPSPALDKRGVSFGLRRDTSPADLQVLDIFITDNLVTGHIDELVKKAIAHETK